MNSVLSQFECLAPLYESKLFVCFARLWWDGAGLDTSYWHLNEKDEVWHRVFKTGETIELKEPEKKIVEKSDLNTLTDLIDFYKNIGGSSFKSQETRSSYLHYDYWLGVRVENISDDHWIYIKGGKPDNPKLNELIIKLLELCPEMQFS